MARRAFSAITTATVPCGMVITGGRMRSHALTLTLVGAVFGCGGRASGDGSGGSGSGGAFDSSGAGTGGAMPDAGGAAGATGGAFEGGVIDALGDTAADGGPAKDAAPGAGTSYVYVSGYSAPITIFTLDTTTGALTPAGMATTGVGGEPTSLAFSPDKRVLYVCDEQKDLPASHVIAFAINQQTGALQEINRQDTGGTTNAHVGVHPSGQWVLSANYGTGDVTVFPVRPDGGLGAAMPRVPVGGQAHFILFDSTGKYLFVPSLADRLLAQFRFADGALTPNAPPTLSVGGDPRHLALAPDERFLYALTQGQATIFSYSLDKTTGRLTPLESVNATATPSLGAHIALHPNGKFLYASSRSDNSIAIFSVNGTTGRLTPAGYQRDMISYPWWFSIDPTGQFLLVANDRSATVTVNRIDPAAGTLQRLGAPVTVPARPTFVGVVTLP